MEVSGASEPGRLWAGALPAGLFRSDDRGEHWELVRPLWDVPERAKWFGGGYDMAGIHSILPDPRDPKRLFVGISCGGVWESKDSGASWTLQGEGLIAAYMPPEQVGTKEVQDPHGVARCASSPELMWTQHHNGVFRSTDAGATWTQLKLPVDDFGFAVAAHPQDPQTAWLVPAIKDELRMPRDGALCVTRPRRRQELGDAARRSAAARRLRPDLPERPRCRFSRHAARDGLDHRRAVGERQRRRALVSGQRAPAADLCGKVGVAPLSCPGRVERSGTRPWTLRRNREAQNIEAAFWPPRFSWIPDRRSGFAVARPGHECA